MGDYMIMLESHLTAGQYRVVGQMQEARRRESTAPVYS